MATIKKCDKCGAILDPKENTFCYEVSITYKRTPTLLKIAPCKDVDLCKGCLDELKALLLWDDVKPTKKGAAVNENQNNAD